MRLFRDINLSAFTAGFVAVLVGFTSSVAIVFQAALAFGATPAQVASWMWALGLGMGLCSAVPSYLWRKPVMVAWSTPGAAVLATAAAGGGYTMPDAIGAFMVCAVLIVLSGATGWFARVMNRIPMAIASALLAGVLTRFGLQAFVAAQTALGLVLLMLSSYLIGRRLTPRYAVVLTLVMAIIYVAACLVVILVNIDMLPTAIGEIFKGAFAPEGRHLQPVALKTGCVEQRGRGNGPRRVAIPCHFRRGHAGQAAA